VRQYSLFGVASDAKPLQNRLPCSCAVKGVLSRDMDFRC
jgi:hypothetical protein